MTKKVKKKETKKVKNTKAKIEKKETVKSTKVVKENKEKVHQVLDSSQPIIKESIDKALTDNMMGYSLTLLYDRAVPSVEDGFKPGQRLFLWGAKKVGADGEHTVKSATIVGEVMGKYHPHGDASIYGTGVRMVGSTLHLNLPLIDGKGGFGKHYDAEQAPAAMRYSEMKLAKFAKEIIDDSVKYHPDNMIDNFDGKFKQPRFISSPVPLILVNAQTGIAVGFSSSLGSFNLGEVCEACKIVIKNFNKDDKDLLKDVCKVMPTMDFTTGGETCIDDEQIKNLYLIGKGQVVCRAIFEDFPKERKLKVVELPYSTDLNAVMKAVLGAVDSGKLTEVTNIKNLSGKTGFDLSIYYKSGTDVEDLKKKLFALTPCQSAYNTQMYVMADNRPQDLGVIACIKKWVEHRRAWVEEDLQNRKKEAEDRLHLLEGLEAILLDIDKAVKIVKNSKSDEEVISGLKKGFKIDDLQAEFVAEIKLRNFNKDYILNKTKEIKDLKALIKEFAARLKDIDTELINDLDEAKKKYGTERKTKIVDKWEELPTFAKNTKEPEKLDGTSTVFIGSDWIKRVPDGSGAKAPNGSTKWENVPNAGEFLIFTNNGRVFKWVLGKIKNNVQTKISEIKRINKKMESGEQIIYICPLVETNNLVIAYSNKKFAKFKLSEYITSSNKLCFTKGVNVKEPIEYIEAISKDKKIEVFGHEVDTKDIKEFTSKTAAGGKIKGIK